jgi:acetoin utilization protein AcuB
MVARDTSIATARDVMERHGIRHLPVLDGADLVGVISDRDILSAERFIDASRTRVGYVMTECPYVASPYSAVADVAAHMAAHKYGSAVVVDDGLVVGIFTAIDGLRALSAGRTTPAVSRTEFPREDLERTG